MSLLDSSDALVDNINSDLYDQVNNCLQINGLSETEIELLQPLYQNLFDDITKNNVHDIINKKAESIENDIKTISNSAQQSIVSINNITPQSALNNNYKVQDAVYGKVFPDKSPLLTKFTSPIQFPEANSELTSNYPFTYGHIDEGCNWYKVNKKESYVEFVHNSGSSIKIDKMGNVAVNITGSLKINVSKDATIEIDGSSDLGLLGNLAVMVNGQVQTEIGSSHDETAGSSISLKAPVINLN